MKDVVMTEKPIHWGNIGVHRIYSFPYGVKLSAVKTDFLGFSEDLWEIVILSAKGKNITKHVWPKLEEDVIISVSDLALEGYVEEISEYDYKWRPNQFWVWWTDCDGFEGVTGFTERGEAEQFAHFCHDLGDTNVKVKEGENENEIPI